MSSDIGSTDSAKLYTEITKDRANGPGHLEPILSMGDIFLQAYLEPGEDDSKYPCAPIDLVWNYQSKLLQNKQTVNPDALYSDYWYQSGINESMIRHLREVVRFAKGFVDIKDDDYIVDIASNDGTLLRQWEKVTDKKILTVGFDPATNLAETASEGVHYHAPICFDGDFFLTRFQDTARVITACAVIYHVPDPVPFFKDIARCLKSNGVFVFEFTYLPVMMANNAIDAVGHEHTLHLSLTSLEPMLQEAGLEIICTRLQDTNSGTLLCAAKLAPSYCDGDHFAFLAGLRNYEWNLGLGQIDVYRRWATRCEGVRRDLIALLGDFHKRGKKIYLYGASTKASILLQWLRQPIGAVIERAVERNPRKIGKKMVGLGIPIISEEQARKDNPDVLFVGPWCFKENFIERERDYLKNGGTMVFPLPEVDIVRG